MSKMTSVVAFISQKGGVGKSTLARALVASAMRVGLAVKTVDLDPQQATIAVWAQARERYKVSPSIKVEAFASAKDVLPIAGSEQIHVIDTRGTIRDEVTEIAAYAQLLVQPTSPTVDDLYPAVLVFRALENVGISRNKLVFALCRTLATDEASDARAYLTGLGYRVLAGDVPEHLEYRKAMNEGRAITEVTQPFLAARAETMIADLLAMIRLSPHQASTPPEELRSATG